MKVKSLPLPKIEVDKPKPKSKKAWVTISAVQNGDTGDDAPVNIDSQVYDHKPTNGEIESEFRAADPGWELIAILEVGL